MSAEPLPTVEEPLTVGSSSKAQSRGKNSSFKRKKNFKGQINTKAHATSLSDVLGKINSYLSAKFSNYVNSAIPGCPLVKLLPMTTIEV